VSTFDDFDVTKVPGRGRHVYDPERQRAVEDTIRAAAVWGWEQARNGMADPPELEFDWDTEDGFHVRLKGARLTWWAKLLRRFGWRPR
jgi:hypothetical protein